MSFEDDGLEVFRVASQEEAERWEYEIFTLNEAGLVERRDVGIEGDLLNPLRHLQLMRGEAVRRYMPVLHGLYLGLGQFLRCRLGKVFFGEYLQSDLNVKIYLSGDTHGWHFDTNPITVLLSLSDMHKTGALETPFTEVALMPGEALLMDGRKVKHRAWATAPRITVPMNYYTAECRERADYIDAVMYGDTSNTLHPIFGADEVNDGKV